MQEAAQETARNQSLVIRLVRSAALWAIPVLAFSAFALTWFYRDSTYRLFDEPLVSTVDSLIANTSVSARYGDKIVDLSRRPIDPDYQRGLSGRYWLVGLLTETGSLAVLDSSRSLSGETLTLPPADILRIRQNVGEEIRTNAAGPDTDTGETLRVFARSVILPDMNTPVVMVAAADSRPASRAVWRFATLAITLMSLLSLGLVIALFMQVRVGLRPLFELRDKVADVREGRAPQVEGEFPQEIQPLATELNFLIDHNRGVVERARTHVGNLAHALKTPLAVLLNEAKTGKTTSSEIVKRQSDTMTKQVEHHLRRARAAAIGSTIGLSMPVKDIVEPLGRTLERIYQNKDVRVQLNLAPGLSFRGEKRDLDEMAGNLMDNGCKWSNGQVRVRAYADREDVAMFYLTVEDNGEGMPPEHFAEAIKRGKRLDEATPGTGFGLAIVDDLAQAYKGSLTLAASDLGGLKAILHLPGRHE